MLLNLYKDASVLCIELVNEDIKELYKKSIVNILLCSKTINKYIKLPDINKFGINVDESVFG